MLEDDHKKPEYILELLRKGKMLDHPGVALHVKRALDTNDYSPLYRFIQTYPVIKALAVNKIAKEEFEQALSPFRPYPSIKDAEEYLSGPLKFGCINEARSFFAIAYDLLCLPILCAGRTGSGKSILIKYLLSQIITKHLDFNVLIPDLKKEYRHQCTDGTNLKVLTQDRIMINPLQIPDWCNRIEDHIVAFSKTFVSENYLVGTSQNILIDLVELLYRSRGIYDGSRNYPKLKDLYDLVTKYLLKAKSFRYTDVLLWIQNRLKPYLLCGSFNCQFGIPFETFQKENLVLEMDTGFTDQIYNFTIATIANQLYIHNKAKNLGGTIKHWFVVDEARILFNAHRDVSNFGESILTEILTKSRAFGISFLLASQESESFNSVMRALSYLKIAFPLNDAEDLIFIQNSFGLSEEQKDALFELPPYGTAVVRYGGYKKPFLLEVPEYQIKLKLSDDELKNRMASFYSELDRHIKKSITPTTVETKTTNIPASSAALLFFLGKYPFTTVSGLVQAPGFKSPVEVNKALSWLIDNDFLQIEKYRTSKTKMSIYPILSDKAMSYLGMENVPGKGSYEHSLYQHLVFEKVSRDGYTAKVEGRMKNSTKLIDVMATSQDKKKNIAFEITLSFHNLIDNINSDFNAGVSEVVIVCRSKEDLQKARSIIEKANFPNNISIRTRCVIIDAFFN
jgi:hypothetical protein